MLGVISYPRSQHLHLFLILFEDIKYDWNKTAPLHPFKTNNLRHLFTDHYTTFHEVLVFCFGTRPRFPRKKNTLLTIPNLVAIKKLCQAPSCATHGGESYSVFLMGIGGKKWADPCVAEPPFQSSRLFLALAPWEWEQPEQYESDWKSFPEGSW